MAPAAQADLKTFQELGVYGVVALTCIVSFDPKNEWQHRFVPVDQQVIADQLEAIQSCYPLRTVKLGMLGTPATIDTVATALQSQEWDNVVLDPVLICKGQEPGAALDTDQALKANILPLATFVTPNHFEAESLSGITIETLEDLEEAARIIHRQSGAVVLAKGGVRPRAPTPWTCTSTARPWRCCPRRRSGTSPSAVQAARSPRPSPPSSPRARHPSTPPAPPRRSSPRASATAWRPTPRSTPSGREAPAPSGQGRRIVSTAADQPEPGADRGGAHGRGAYAAGDVVGGPDTDPATDDDGRGESSNQRLDRNWQEMLQELRVMQTGIQILTGFLLTLPFQSRFDELDDTQVLVYLCLVCLSALITALVLSSVNLHRVLFGLRVKATLVQHTAVIIRATIALVGLVLAGTAWLIFDLVVGRTAGLVVAGSILLVVLLLWVVYPFALRRRAVRNRAAP